jgi:hypothetical protein
MFNRLDDRSLILGKDRRFFCTPLHPDRLWGLPAFYSVGTGALFLVVKRLVREAHHFCWIASVSCFILVV